MTSESRCRDCAQPPEPGRVRCRKHLNKRNRQVKRRNERKRDRKLIQRVVAEVLCRFHEVIR